jgi:hypothetical protein
MDTNKNSLAAAEQSRDAVQEHLASVEKKLAFAVEQIAKTKKSMADFEEIPGSKLCSNDILNHEKARRYLTSQEADRVRLETELLPAAREKLEQADRAVDLVRLPSVLAEFQRSGAALTDRVEALADLAKAFREHGRLKDQVNALAASTGQRVRMDDVALGWSVVSGLEFGNSAPLNGNLGDALLVRLAMALHDHRRAGATRASAARARAQEASATSAAPNTRSWPGLHTEPTRLVREIAQADRAMLDLHHARQIAEESVASVDFDPIKNFLE